MFLSCVLLSALLLVVGDFEPHYYYLDLDCNVRAPIVKWVKRPVQPARYYPSPCQPKDDLCSSFCNPKGQSKLRVIHSMSVFISGGSVRSSEVILWEKDLGAGCKGVVLPGRVAVFTPKCFPKDNEKKFCWKYETPLNLASMVLAHGTDLGGCNDFFHFAFNLPDIASRDSKPSIVHSYNAVDWTVLGVAIGVSVGFGMYVLWQLRCVRKSLKVIRYKCVTGTFLATAFVNGYEVEIPVEKEIKAGRWTWEPQGPCTGRLTVTTSCTGSITGAVDYAYHLAPEISFTVLKPSSGQLFLNRKPLPFPVDITTMSTELSEMSQPLLH